MTITPSITRNLVRLDPTRIEEIAQAATAIGRQVDHLGECLRILYQGRFEDPRPPSQLVEETIHRTDEAFRLANEADALIRELDQSEPFDGREALLALLQSAARRGSRYNRQSLGFLERDPIAAIPLTHYRNFLRDNSERMYFLALHDLPTAYDFFCCTYVETPPGYRQEIHLHRYSEELTLILEGRSDCAWFREDEQGRLHECGRVTAGPLQAFRIPAGVPHTIDSCHGANRNLTIKLSTFIEDRVGERDWRFRDEHKSPQQVTVDGGGICRELSGNSIFFTHGHANLRFNYQIKQLKSGSSCPLPPGPIRHLFLFAGTLLIRANNDSRPCHVEANAVIRIASSSDVTLDSCARLYPARFFILTGFEETEFPVKSEHLSEFSKWLIDDILRTITPTLAKSIKPTVL